MFGAFDPDKVLSAAFLVSACLVVTVWALRNKIIWHTTQERALAEKDAQIRRIREDHEKQGAAFTAQFAVVLASKDKDLDKLWTAWNLEAASNQREITVLIEEMSASSQLVTEMARALDRARSQEVARSDIGATRSGRGRSVGRIGGPVRQEVEMGGTPEADVDRRHGPVPEAEPFRGRVPRPDEGAR